MAARLVGQHGKTTQVLSIRFRNDDWERLYEEGRKRYRNAIKGGYHTPTISGVQDQEDNDARAFIAENAVAFVLRLAELNDPTTGGALIGENPDSGWDLITLDGFTFDVKYTGHKGGHLLFQNIAKFRADAAVLCWPGYGKHDIDIVGGIKRNRWYQEVFTKQLTPERIGWLVKSEKLSPMSQVLSLLRKRRQLHEMTLSPQLEYAE